MTLGNKDYHCASYISTRRSVQYPFWQLIPACDYSNAERMFAMPTFIPVGDYSNAERMLSIQTFTPLFTTTKVRAGGSSKNGAAYNAEKVERYFMHTDKVTKDSSADSFWSHSSAWESRQRKRGMSGLRASLGQFLPFPSWTIDVKIYSGGGHGDGSRISLIYHAKLTGPLSEDGVN